MSEKATCPGCNAYTSSVFRAFEEGHPCPSCGLSADAAEAVEKARERKATADLAERLLAAERRAEKAEREARALRAIVAEVQVAVERCNCGGSAHGWEEPDLPHSDTCPARERS